MNYSAATLGNLAMLAYVFLTALSSIMIHRTTQQIPPLLSAFYTFLFCLLAYNLFTRLALNKIKIIQQYWLPILMLNVTTAISWICAFFALKWIPPELFLYIYLCAMPMAQALINKTDRLKTWIYLLGLIFLTWSYHRDQLLLGFILAFLGGTSGTVYSIYSKKITAVFSTLEILSIRFYLTVLITFFISVYFHYFVLMNKDFYLQFMLLSLITVIFPLLLFQTGLKHLHLTKALAYLPLAPLLCYSFNTALHLAQFNWIQMLAVMLITVAMFLKF